MLLRRLRASDRAEFCRVLETSRFDVEPWMPLNEAGESDAAFFCRQIDLAKMGDERGVAWRRVAVLPGGRIAGFFNLNAISRGLTWEADATWWLASDCTGLGLAQRGIRMMLAHAFEPLPRGLGLWSVHAGIDHSNERCVRTAMASGFARIEGQRSHLKVGDNWVMHDFYLARSPQL
jgi:RimJ/RimL family protein N-acetyltransferase